jgi:hypothetical protein
MSAITTLIMGPPVVTSTTAMFISVILGLRGGCLYCHPNPRAIADMVIFGTLIDLSRVVKSDQPFQRVRYEFQ